MQQILWVLDVISWMLSFALINGEKKIHKNKPFCRARDLKHSPETQTANNAWENLSHACVEGGGETLEQRTGAAEASAAVHSSPGQAEKT